MKMEQNTIKDHYKSRKAELEDIVKNVGNTIEYLEKYENLEKSILSVDVTKTHNILLSCGGPADGYKVKTTLNDELINIRYWYADFNSYNEIKLDEKETRDFLSVYGYLVYKPIIPRQ